MKRSVLLLNLLLIAITTILLTPIVGITPIITAIVLVLAGAALHIAKRKYGVSLFAGLAPEVWLPLVKENFYPSNSFLNAATDMSGMVDNDKINFAEAGADPTVMKNNTTYPITATVATDLPLNIELDYYDTDSTIVRNAIAIELAYDQRVLYANKHKKAMLKRLGQDAAFAYAPTQNDATKFNTVISMGANDSVIDACIDLQKAYNDMDEDGSQRNLILCPSHMAAIAKEDKVLYKAIMAEAGSTFYGFKIWNYTKLPIYIASTGVKAAQGAAFVQGTHKLASVSFLGSEVMKATGTMKLFSKLNDPDIKGDSFNFQMRALVSSLRGKYSGAILR